MFSQNPGIKMAQACRSKQKKRRNKSNCIKNIFYNVSDILCDRINVKGKIQLIYFLYIYLYISFH